MRGGRRHGRRRTPRPQDRRAPRRRTGGGRPGRVDRVDPLDARWRQSWPRRNPPIARIEVGGLVGSASGSGVLFRDDGYLITNAHVVSDASVISVILGGRLAARGDARRQRHRERHRRREDRRHRLPDRVLSDRRPRLQVGQQAIAIGSPLGLEGGPTATVGIISALDRTVQTHGGDEPLTGMIQTDASIAAGSSGGGLFDTNGSLVGITTAVAITESGTEGLGLRHPDRTSAQRGRAARHRRQGRARLARRARRRHGDRARSRTTAPTAGRCSVR